jgi:hypothetical protein
LKSVKIGPPKKQTPGEEADKAPEDSAFAKYPNVIDYDGDTINILKVQGTKNTEKTRSLVLMYLWANEQIGKNTASNMELMSLCKEHECYDVANFKTILKNTKGITLKGTSRRYSVRLTVPGRNKAKELMESLNEES